MAAFSGTRAALFSFGILFGIPGAVACSSSQPVVYESYSPAFRQYPPEPVYGRLSWSHLPQPNRPRARNDSPMFNPQISFEMPDAKFGEAVEVLAQTIGYRWHYPGSVGGHQVSVKMVGTVEQILEELSAQAGVRAMVDHETRMVRVLDERMVPTLPKQ